MNRRTVLSLVAVGVALSACQRNTLRIEGELDSAPNGKIYLSVLDSSYSWVAVDTATIKDGSFLFEGEYVTEPECMLLTVGNQNMALFAGSDNVKLTGSLLQPEKIVVSGSELNDKLIAFTEGIPGRERLMQLQVAIGSMGNNVDGREEIAAEMHAIELEQLDYINNSIKENKGNPLGPFILLNSLRLFTFDEVDTLHVLFENSIPGHKYVRYIDNLLESLREKNEALKRVEVGQVAPDFALVSVNGDTLTLSDLRGSVVLLNFWSVRDPQCRQEKASLSGMYHKMHAKGMDMVSIAVDADRDEWATVIAEDKFPGYQLLDNGTVAKTYCITKVPYSLFIDENGVIMSKDNMSQSLFEGIASKLEKK